MTILLLLNLVSVEASLFEEEANVRNCGHTSGQNRGSDVIFSTSSTAISQLKTVL
jgi:hypothetical protein